MTEVASSVLMICWKNKIRNDLIIGFHDLWLKHGEWMESLTHQLPSISFWLDCFAFVAPSRKIVQTSSTSPTVALSAFVVHVRPCPGRELRQAGVGAEVKHAPVISAEEEDQLWRLGAVGIDSPKALLRAVFFYVGKTFCLRGGQEQRELRPSQFTRLRDPDHYQYIENGSKNHTGSFGKKDANKVVRICADRDAEPRCLVFLLDLYFSKLPADPKSLPAFYMKPLSKAPVDPHQPWFFPTPIGRNTLGKIVQTMCDEAGIK